MLNQSEHPQRRGGTLPAQGFGKTLPRLPPEHPRKRLRPHGKAARICRKRMRGRHVAPDLLENPRHFDSRPFRHLQADQTDRLNQKIQKKHTQHRIIADGLLLRLLAHTVEKGADPSVPVTEHLITLAGLPARKAETEQAAVEQLRKAAADPARRAGAD